MTILQAIGIILHLAITTLYVTIPVPATVLNMSPCGNMTCLNNGVCRNRTNGVQFCLCKRGFQGHICDDDLDECKYGHVCFHRGKCLNNIGSYRCACFNGWMGELDHCAIKDNSTTVRECEKGWLGEWCQDQCLNNSMCRSNEVCTLHNTPIVSQRGPQCHCSAGWYGRYCTIDKNECFGNPCPETATCINTPGSFVCRCLPAWNGLNCDIDVDECLVNPCQHSSNCTNTLGSYNCTCTEGWERDNCEINVDECVMDPCNGSTNCKNIPGSFTCSENSVTGNLNIIIGAVSRLLVLLRSIIVGIVILKRKFRKSTSTVDSQYEREESIEQHQNQKTETTKKECHDNVKE